MKWMREFFVKGEKALLKSKVRRDDVSFASIA